MGSVAGEGTRKQDVKRGIKSYEEDPAAARLVPMRVVAARIDCCERTAWAAWHSGLSKLLASPQANEVVKDLAHNSKVIRRAVRHDYWLRAVRPGSHRL